MSLLKILYLITFKISLFSNIAYSQNINIVVATVDKEKIYLEEVMRLVEQLPQEFKDKPLETYFSDIINDIIDTKLAAKIAKSALKNKTTLKFEATRTGLISAKDFDKIYVNLSNTGIAETYSAPIQMLDNSVSVGQTIAAGENIGFKQTQCVGTSGGPNDETTLNTNGNHTFITGESVIIIQDQGNIHDGISDHRLYYIIRT